MTKNNVINHIAFLTPEFPHPLSTSSGGLGTSIKNLAEALRDKGLKITVFIYGQKINKVITEAGINYHFIKQKKYKFLGWYRYRKFLQKYLNKEIENNQINLLEVPDWTGITAFMNIKCPVIMKFHGSDAYFCHLEGRPQKKRNFWFEKNAVGNADYLVSVSHFASEVTKELFSIKREVEIIPNSIDIEYFKSDNSNIEKNSILYFGSIIRKKGVLDLADIFNIVIEEKPETKLLFAGKDTIDQLTGKSTKQLIEEKLTPSARKKVEWLGFLPYEKILRQVAIANVVVLPSYAEALPMTWIEAMAMEKALVTSNIGWAKEVMIDGKTGFTVDPGNHILYAEKIIKFMKDSKLAEKLGKMARYRVVNNFSNEVIVRKNMKFYETILGNHY